MVAPELNRVYVYHKIFSVLTDKTETVKTKAAEKPNVTTVKNRTPTEKNALPRAETPESPQTENKTSQEKVTLLL